MKIGTIIFALSVVCSLSLCADRNSDGGEGSTLKIKGMTLESPPGKIEANRLKPVSEIHANYVAIVPYAFTPKGKPEVFFNHERQWWGEKEEGVVELIKMARLNNMDVMIKPQVWMHRGWVGDFYLTDESDWSQWEKAYSKYVLFYARVCAENDVKIFCIGTEYKQVAVKRPEYWKSLIKQVRAIYSGKLTYAANWDEYDSVKFWNELDFIGVNAYFPLSKVKNPTVDKLKTKWENIIPGLSAFAKQYGKPILFTEFGYRSVDGAAGNQWELDEMPLNLAIQANAFRAFFETVWKDNQIAGGFIWKWEFDTNAGGANNLKYTPQGKPALQVISGAYSVN